MAALLLFAAVGRFSHGFSVFDLETFKTADPFIAGMVPFLFLSEMTTLFIFVLTNDRVNMDYLCCFVRIGWYLSAYFLGGYGEEGRGKNGLWRAVIAATKSWSLGIPVTHNSNHVHFLHTCTLLFVSLSRICILYCFYS